MITRSLPSDRRTSLVYVALGDSTVYGLGASTPHTNYVARLFAHLRWKYPAARLTNLGTCLATAGLTGKPTPPWSSTRFLIWPVPRAFGGPNAR